MESSFVDDFYYRPEKEEVVFILKGREYTYPEISEGTYKLLALLAQKLESKGKMYNIFKELYGIRVR